MPTFTSAGAAADPLAASPEVAVPVVLDGAQAVNAKPVARTAAAKVLLVAFTCVPFAVKQGKHFLCPLSDGNLKGDSDNRKTMS